MQITENMQENLQSATSWVKFLAIMGCLSAGFMILAGFGLLGAGLFSGTDKSMLPLAAFYLAMGGMYVYICIKAFGFVSNTRKAMLMDDEHAMEMGFWEFYNLVKNMGILVIVSIVFAFVIVGMAMHNVAYFMH